MLKAREMKMRSLPGLFAAAALFSTPIDAVAGGPAPKEDAIESETKKVNGRSVTILTQVRGSMSVVVVKIAAYGIKYGDIAVTGLNKEGQEIALRPYARDGVTFPSSNPGGSLGMYGVVLLGKEQLAKVKLTWGEESETFDLAVTGTKP